MIFVIWPFLATAISFAGNVMTLLTSEKQETPAINLTANTLDKKFLQRVIQESDKHLAVLLKETEGHIIEELKKQQIRGAIFQVQAHTRSLKFLLDLQTTETEKITQLVATALHPLQVTLEMARLQLEEYGRPDLWEYCYLIGGSALLAGYHFLGIDIPTIREELKRHLSTLQRKMLKEVALKLLSQQDDFPWEHVPTFLSPEGAKELSQLYSTLQTTQKTAEETHRSGAIKQTRPESSTTVNDDWLLAWQ